MALSTAWPPEMGFGLSDLDIQIVRELRTAAEDGTSRTVAKLAESVGALPEDVDVSLHWISRHNMATLAGARFSATANEEGEVVNTEEQLWQATTTGHSALLDPRPREDLEWLCYCGTTNILEDFRESIPGTENGIQVSLTLEDSCLVCGETHQLYITLEWEPWVRSIGIWEPLPGEGN